MPGRTDRAPSLAQIQAEFAARLAGRESGAPGGTIGPDGAVPLKRFNIYRNNAAATLIETLRARYPVIERLVGEEFFKATAYRFIAGHPPRSPALFEFGGGFPDFLAGFGPAQTLPYLPDVARLEWLRHAAYHAPDAEPMQAAALGRVPPKDAGRIVLRLHPSAGLLISDYPALSIWETNIADEVVREIGPERAGEAALVLRRELEVKVIRLGPGGDILLDGITQGACLAEAATRAASAAPEFSLPDALGALLAAGAFAGFSLSNEQAS